MRVDGGNARIDNVGSIATTGDRSHGIHVINGENTVVLNSGTITTTGARAYFSGRGWPKPHADQPDPATASRPLVSAPTASGLKEMFSGSPLAETSRQRATMLTIYLGDEAGNTVGTIHVTANGEIITNGGNRARIECRRNSYQFVVQGTLNARNQSAGAEAIRRWPDPTFHSKPGRHRKNGPPDIPPPPPPPPPAEPVAPEDSTTEEPLAGLVEEPASTYTYTYTYSAAAASAGGEAGK